MSDHLVKIFFRLDHTDWHGSSAETLWAEPLAGATVGSAFRLRNTPFYVRGVSFLDTVRAAAASDGPGLEFAGVIDRSGHSTYMLLVPPICADFDKYWARLEALGCAYESATHRISLGERMLYAVDVPASSDIYAVYSILEEGERQNIWMFQEGHVGHEAPIGDGKLPQ
jgi:hypothetical protein